MPNQPIPQFQIRVTEKHGIRRFLYPLQAELDSDLPNDILLVNSSGAIVPQHIDRSQPGKTTIRFAISMAPNETVLLHFERADWRVPVIPDPLKITQGNGKIRSEQEKVAFEFAENGLMSSVVYDDAEHLAGPLQIKYCDKSPNSISTGSLIYQSSLSAAIAYTLEFPDITIELTTMLTCCKSWIEIEAQFSPIVSPTSDPNTSSLGEKVSFQLPLAEGSTVQTLDYGFGNGAYGRLDSGSKSVTLAAQYINKPQPVYEICHVNTNGETRTDYRGTCVTLEDALSRLWLHWNEPTKALALAVSELGDAWQDIGFKLDSNGLCTVSAISTIPLTSKNSAIKLCYHFLNAIPPIAAATNPASIICKPEVVVESAKSS